MFHQRVRRPRIRIFTFAIVALASSFASASELPEVRLHCRGARTMVDDEGRTSFRWVERAFDIDYSAGKVFDEAGDPIASEITDGEIRLKVKISDWPPGRLRAMTIDRASGAWSARPVEPDATLDVTKGTCLRLAG
jgi:hypothetical protein